MKKQQPLWVLIFQTHHYVFKKHLITIQDYIKITDFEINSLMFSWFWQIMIDDNRSSHLGRPILEWFGYEGADWKSKTKFKELLDRNNVPYKEIFDYIIIKIDYINYCKTQ